MCNCREEDEKEVYEFTYIDSFGCVNHMYKEVECFNENIVDVLIQMRDFLLMCGFKVDELVAKNNYVDFSTEDY